MSFYELVEKRKNLLEHLAVIEEYIDKAPAVSEVKSVEFSSSKEYPAGCQYEIKSCKKGFIEKVKCGRGKRVNVIVDGVCYCKIHHNLLQRRLMKSKAKQENTSPKASA